MRLAFALLAFPLALLALAGCGSDDGEDDTAAATEPAFVDVPWVLACGLDVEGWEESPPSVVFQDGAAGGSTGCNRFTAPYTVDGESLELGQIASTQMACPPPADEVERTYVDALGRVAG